MRVLKQLREIFTCKFNFFWMNFSFKASDNYIIDSENK